MLFLSPRTYFGPLASAERACICLPKAGYDMALGVFASHAIGSIVMNIALKSMKEDGDDEGWPHE